MSKESKKKRTRTRAEQILNPRSSAEINEDYQELCGQLGDFVLKTLLTNEGIEELVKKVRALSAEMDLSQAKENQETGK